MPKQSDKAKISANNNYCNFVCVNILNLLSNDFLQIIFLFLNTITSQVKISFNTELVLPNNFSFKISVVDDVSVLSSIRYSQNIFS